MDTKRWQQFQHKKCCCVLLGQTLYSRFHRRLLAIIHIKHRNSQL